MNKAVWIALMAAAIALMSTFLALAATRNATEPNDSEKAE